MGGMLRGRGGGWSMMALAWVGRKQRHSPGPPRQDGSICGGGFDRGHVELQVGRGVEGRARP